MKNKLLKGFSLFTLTLAVLFVLTHNVSASASSGLVPINGTKATTYAHFKSTDNGPGIGRNKGTANVDGCFTATVRQRGGGIAIDHASGCYIGVRTNTAKLSDLLLKDYPYVAAMGQ
ncbi:MAG: hypothetical protein GX233_07665 [Erysipelothrix sp.]|nr:hypothetical protein [Erysipelothrix sp.]